MRSPVNSLPNQEPASRRRSSIKVRSWTLPLTVCGAVDGIVVDGDEAGVAGELEIGFDECGAERYGAAKGSQSIFGRVAGSSSMCYDEHGYTRSFELTWKAGFADRRESVLTTGHLKTC